MSQPSHLHRLGQIGISATRFAYLTGVNVTTVLNWGKARPSRGVQAVPDWVWLLIAQWERFPHAIPAENPSIAANRRVVPEGANRLHCGDVFALAPGLRAQSIDLVFCSPPYAQQRPDGIAPSDYPAWTVRWATALRQALKPFASVLIVCRPPVVDGRMMNFMHHTCLAMEQAGLPQIDDVMWYKPDGPPLGNNKWLRRGHEPVFWFSAARKPFVDPKARGELSTRLGLIKKKGAGDYINQTVSGALRTGIARAQDVFYGPVAGVGRNSTHTSSSSLQLATGMIATFCPPGGVVLDPFMGSGTTAEAALQTDRFYIGFDRSAEAIAEAAGRIAKFSRR